MKKLLACLALACLIALKTPALAIDDYKIGADSMTQPGVPQGVVTHFVAKGSKVFPGSEHDYWVYVPKQYSPEKSACVMVFQDGGGYQDRNGGFRVPVVFDNLIAKKEMPVTIAIMINPGVLRETKPSALPRFNRSHEYDGMSGDYAKFLIEEILPEVGKSYNLTKDPNERAISGASSGGICAFTAAWRRPDYFRRVASFIGSFTDLQGGNVYNSLIRKMEPKPLRVFLQDGSNDQDIYSGSWPNGSKEVFDALTYSGYDCKFVLGDGRHSGTHGAAILPDVMRWLWRDYPNSIATPGKSKSPVMGTLISGEPWSEVEGDYLAGNAIATDAKGNVVFSSKEGVFQIGTNGKVELLYPNKSDIAGLAFDPEGNLCATLSDSNQLRKFSASKISSQGLKAKIGSFVIDHSGCLYGSDTKTGSIVRIVPSGKMTFQKFPGFHYGNLALSPDQTLLFASSVPSTRFVQSYQIQKDGSLDYGQDYFDLAFLDEETQRSSGGMTSDRDGWLYVSSGIGIQMLDQAGRVNGIIENPTAFPTEQVVFGGEKLQTLYAISNHRVFRRKTKATGVLPFAEPVKPPFVRL